jgi:hypothetical protein
MEGILHNFLTRLRNDQQMMIHTQTLEELEELIWRCCDLEIVPSHCSLETLWEIQQEVHERQCKKIGDLDDIQMTKSSGTHVDRSIQLFLRWISWANQYSSHISPPRPPYIEEIFQIARDADMSMTNEMWQLHEIFVTEVSRTFSYDISRNYFTTVFQILARSPTPWKIKQTTILKQLDTMCRLTGNQVYNPTISELESSLEVASENGWSQEATWIYQTIQNMGDSTRENGDTFSRFQDLWFHAIINDDEEDGSIVYLEMLLLHSKSEFSKRLHSRNYFNKYLQKLADSGSADAGIRAEAFFLGWKNMSADSTTNNEEDTSPNNESVHAVVMAYMQGEAPKEVQLSQAERFLKEHRISA